MARPASIGSRRRLEVDAGAPQAVVQAEVRQHHLAGRDLGPQALAAPLALHAAHFEQVDEVGVERELQPHLDAARCRGCVRRMCSWQAPCHSSLARKMCSVPLASAGRPSSAGRSGFIRSIDQQAVGVLHRRAQVAAAARRRSAVPGATGNGCRCGTALPCPARAPGCRRSGRTSRRCASFFRTCGCSSALAEVAATYHLSPIWIFFGMRCFLLCGRPLGGDAARFHQFAVDLEVAPRHARGPRSAARTPGGSGGGRCGRCCVAAAMACSWFVDDEAGDAVHR